MMGRKSNQSILRKLLGSIDSGDFKYESEPVWKKTKKWLAIAIWGRKEEFETELLNALSSPSIKVKMFDYFVP